MKKNKLMEVKERQDAVGAHFSEPRKVHPDLILMSQNDDHALFDLWKHMLQLPRYVA